MKPLPPPPQTVLVPQLQSQATARLVDIFYASGQRQQVNAVYRGPFLLATGEVHVMLSVPASEATSAVTSEYDELMGLDPLCVVVDTLTSQVVYEPNMILELPTFPEVLKKRFNELANWPQLLELRKGKAGELYML